MIRVLTALAAAVVGLSATPAHAFYGIQAGTPFYDALQRGYRPPPFAQQQPLQYFYYYAAPSLPVPAPRR